MAWIKTTPIEQAGDVLRHTYEAIYSLYPKEYGQKVPGIDESITSAHSLIPEAMRHMLSGLGVLLQPTLPLTRRQQEMIASVVSVQNSCFY
jgi:hypothetical protein